MPSTVVRLHVHGRFTSAGAGVPIGFRKHPLQFQFTRDAFETSGLLALLEDFTGTLIGLPLTAR